MRLTPAPETPPRDTVKLKGASPFAGATVVNISPAITEEMSLQGPAAGVAVAEIENGSFAQQLNLQRGDVIIAVNDQKIENTHDLERVTATRAYYWKVTLARGGQVFTTVVGG
jgi:S1-C subfamily serine protease